MLRSVTRHRTTQGVCMQRPPCFLGKGSQATPLATPDNCSNSLAPAWPSMCARQTQIMAPAGYLKSVICGHRGCPRRQACTLELLWPFGSYSSTSYVTASPRPLMPTSKLARNSSVCRCWSLTVVLINYSSTLDCAGNHFARRLVCTSAVRSRTPPRPL